MMICGGDGVPAKQNIVYFLKNSLVEVTLS